MAVRPVERGGGAGRFGRGWREWAGPGLLVVAGVVLFVVYLGQSGRLAMTSDSAVKALQAWDMLHGNVLLRGWTASDVSFYTTELPQYALIEAVHGLGGVVHVAAAMSFTLVVVLSGLAARGRARGREGATRLLVTVTVMLAPQLRLGTYLFLAGPDHLGTQVPVLAVLLVLDRARPRWWVPVVVAVLLAWGTIGDELVALEMTAPLVAVCAVRVYQRREQLAGWWYELSLCAAAGVSLAASRLVIAAVRQAGGFRTLPLNAGFAPAAEAWRTAAERLQSVLSVFGADFFGYPAGLAAVSALVHLAGLGLAGWALASVLRRFCPAGLMVQVLAAALVLLAFLYLAGTKPDPNEAVGLLPLGAVLAGRVLAGPILTRGLAPALGLLLAGNLAFLALNAAPPPKISQNQRVAAWLARHHLRYGLAGYWQASSITAFTGDRTQVRPVREYRHHLAATPAEADATWYRPRSHDATFIVLTRNGGCLNVCLSRTDLQATYGPPAATHHVGQYTVLIWHANLLRGVRIINWCGNVWPWATHTTPSPHPCPSQ